MTSRGEPGATGPTGTFVGGYPSLAALQSSVPVGKPGEFYLIDKEVYGFDPITNGWRHVGPLRGPTGPTGPTIGAGAMPPIAIGTDGNWIVGPTNTGRPARGATGEPGTVAAIVGSYPSQAALQAARPSGPAGVYNLVGGDLYGYDPGIGMWYRIGPIGGPTGPTGTASKVPEIKPGTNGNWYIGGSDTGKPSRGPTGPKGPTGAVKAAYQTPADLQNAKPNGPPGDFYLIGDDLYSYDPALGSWINVGPIVGPPGPAGASGPAVSVTIGPNGNFFVNNADSGQTSRASMGPTGPTGTFVGGYLTVEDMRAANPTGSPGEYLLVNRRVYEYDPATKTFKDIGPLGGPTGPTGLPGVTGSMAIGPDKTFLVNGADTRQTALGDTGPTGPPGDLTIGFNGNWFVNGFDTRIPARGPAGDTGAGGAGSTPKVSIGPDGNWLINGANTGKPARGPTGPDGVVTIGENKNFWVNGADTGDTALGQPGPTGPTGAIAIGTNGNWVVNNADTGKPSRGPTGDTGPNGDLAIGPTGTWVANGTDTGRPSRGATGATGLPGPAGLAGATAPASIGADGNWVLNGVKTDKPASGPTGATGLGAKIAIGTNNNWFIDGSDTNKPAKGPTGPTGPAGASGVEAVVDINPKGNWTVDGRDTGYPARGRTGPTGATGIIPDVKIVNGNWYIGGVDRGIRAIGATGPTGPSGTLAPSSQATFIQNGTDSKISMLGFIGPTGPNGKLDIGFNEHFWENEKDTGVPARGVTGPTGPSGPTGPTGPTGPFSVSGPLMSETFYKGDENTGVPARGIPGMTGPAGPVGADGLPGPAGPAGTSPQGPTGPTGPPGPPGPSQQGESGGIVRYAYNQGSYSGGSMYNPVRLPFEPVNNPGAAGNTQGYTYRSNQSSGDYNSNQNLFEATWNGFRVKQDGTYLVTGMVKVDEKNQANTYAIGVNGRVQPGDVGHAQNTFSTDSTGNQVTNITTQLKLKANDELSLNLVSNGTSKLNSWPGLGTTQTPGSPTLVMSAVKIA